MDVKALCKVLYNVLSITHTTYIHEPFFLSLYFKIYILSSCYCLAGSLSASLKDWCSAMKKKCHYSEDTVILNWMMTLWEAVWESLVEEKIFSVYKKEPWVKKENTEKYSFKISRLGLYFSLCFWLSMCPLSNPWFFIGLSSSENPVLDWMTLTLTCKIFFT